LDSQLSGTTRRNRHDAQAVSDGKSSLDHPGHIITSTRVAPSHRLPLNTRPGRHLELPTVKGGAKLFGNLAASHHPAAASGTRRVCVRVVSPCCAPLLCSLRSAQLPVACRSLHADDIPERSISPAPAASSQPLPYTARSSPWTANRQCSGSPCNSARRARLTTCRWVRSLANGSRSRASRLGRKLVPGIWASVP